jgi:isopentenyldiphosphate isomerase
METQGKARDVSQEWLPVVNDRDEVIGKERRGMVHAKGLLHRAVHVLVFRADGRLYLQRRSLFKDTSAGKWDSSCSGHVDPGESYEQSALRELREEIGLDLSPPLETVGRLPASAATGNEFTLVFRKESELEPIPNPDEIMEGRWVSIEELDHWMASSPADFARCFIEVWALFRNSTANPEAILQ